MDFIKDKTDSKTEQYLQTRRSLKKSLLLTRAASIQFK